MDISQRTSSEDARHTCELTWGTAVSAWLMETRCIVSLFLQV
jgi:hypothetical protein